MRQLLNHNLLLNFAILHNDRGKASLVALVGKDDNGNDVAETRTVFDGESFNIGTYLPANVPAGKRWIGWSETAGATENDVDETIVVTEPKTFYAVFEDLVEFDYSNYYHQYGTTVKSGTGNLVFDDGLAIVEVAGEIAAALHSRDERKR